MRLVISEGSRELWPTLPPPSSIFERFKIIQTDAKNYFTTGSKSWIGLNSMQKPQNQDIDAAKHVEEDPVNVIEEGCVGKIPQPWCGGEDHSNATEKWYSRWLQKPKIVEDTQTCVASLHGLNGVLVFMNQSRRIFVTNSQQEEYQRLWKKKKRL